MAQSSNVQKELWIDRIENNLSQSNAFMKFATDHSAWADGLYIHVPNSGPDPAITKNNSSFPLVGSQRTDLDLNYAMNTYSTALINVTGVEEIQTSYAKIDSVLSSHVRKLADTMGNNTCYAWAASAQTNGVTRIVRTTGALSATSLSSGSTGNRKQIVLADILAAKNILDSDLVPSEGRVLLVPSAMFNELLSIPAIYQQYSYGSPTLKDGVAANIYGFNIVERPNVVTYTSGVTTSALVIKSTNDDGTVNATAVSDVLGAIAYHPDFVAIAKGETKIYADQDRSDYQGDTISARVIHGATVVRPNRIGVVGIVQAGS